MEAPQKATKRIITAIAAAMLVAISSLADAALADVAYIDVVKIVSESPCGQAGQKIVDDLLAKLNSQFTSYSRIESSQEKLRARRLELDDQFKQEHDRVTQMIYDRLRQVCEKWLRTNKKGVTAIMPMTGVIAVKPEADVTKSIQRLFSLEKIDFDKK